MSKSSYFKWLRKLVGCDDTLYGDLMVYLFNKQFYWVVGMDENRAEDGKALRDLYLERHPRVKECDFINEPCSVLEMLIALARRWRVDLTSEDGNEEGFGLYFWEMIGNLGLDSCVNSSFDRDFVDKIVTDWLDRSYSDDGIGSLFPGSGNCKDEIWYQLQAYLRKKGDF